MCDSLCWVQPQDSPECKTGDPCAVAPGSARSWLHWEELGSEREKWRGKERRERVLQLSEGEIPLSLEHGTAAREFRQLCVTAPVCESWGVRDSSNHSTPH